MTVLTITAAGMAKENDALANGAPMPKVKKLVIGKGVPKTDPVAATALTDKWYESNILVVEKLSAGAMKLHGEVPPDQVGNITEIGIVLEDGTLYAYAAYQASSNGLYKASGFAFSFFVILSRETLPSLTFTYSPIDIPTLTLQIITDAKSSIDVYLQAYLLQMVKALSGINKDILNIRDKLQEVRRHDAKGNIIPL